MLESCLHGRSSELTIIKLFSLGGWNVTDRLKQAAVIEPVYPFERSHLDSLQVAPRAKSMNHFSLVQTVYRLGQCVIVGVAHAAYRRFDASFN